MDQKLKKICGLLQSPDNMRRCGAAVVLAELAPKDPAVVKALGEALQTANQTLMTCILDALDAIASRSALPYVMPLLNAEDMGTRLRAVAIISKAGNAVLPQIKRRLDQARPREKLALVDILARIHRRDAFRMVLDILYDSDFELAKETCDAVRRHIKDAGPKDRLSLHKQVASFANSERVKKRERVLTSSLLLLGSIGRPEARTVLLKYSTPKTAPYVRRHALIGLKGLECSGPAAGAVARKVLGYLNESDPDIVRHAIDVIGRQPMSCLQPAQWRKLLKSKHGSVCGVAARKIAENETTINNRLLVELLSHEDNNVREIAAGALSGRKKAARILLDALRKESNPESAWSLAKILKPHSESIDKKTLKTFARLTESHMQAGKPQHEPLLYFLRNADPKTAESVVLETGLKFKQTKKWAQAVQCLRRLINTESFDDNAGYALSVCNLKLSTRDFTPPLRAQDHALRGFQRLLRNRSFKLLEQLKKDRSLNADELYYVAFHFSEQVSEDREFGEQLLDHVARKWPRSKQGKAAKNKLKLIHPKPRTTPARKKSKK
ncbi:HEAT repeat domain-containing protein [Verrucomicrobiota bacterium]